MLEQVLRQSFGSVAHIAHHVQECYFQAPTHAHHNPSRVQNAENIASLTKAFFEIDIPTFATAIIEEWDDDGSIHFEVKRLAKEIGHLGRSRSVRLPSGNGIEASAYSYHFSAQLENYPVHILTGFNASSCVLDTGLICLEEKKARLIIPKDCIEDAWVSRAPAQLDKDQAIKIMKDKGAIISSMDEILTTIDRLKPTLVM